MCGCAAVYAGAPNGRAQVSPVRPVRTCRCGGLVEPSGQGDVEALKTVRVGGDVDGGDGWAGEGELDHQREPAEWSHDQGRTSVDQSQGGAAGSEGCGNGASGHGQGAVK